MARARTVKQVVFTTYVEHPGTPPQPFLRPAAKQAQQQLKKKFLPAAFKRINKGKDITKELGKAVKASAFYGLRIAQQLCPVDKGHLRRSLTVKEESVLFWQLGTGVAYAKWVEEGTEPHVILPRRKSVLRFVVKRPRVS